MEGLGTGLHKHCSEHRSMSAMCVGIQGHPRSRETAQNPDPRSPSYLRLAVIGSGRSPEGSYGNVRSLPDQPDLGYLFARPPCAPAGSCPPDRHPPRRRELGCSKRRKSGEPRRNRTFNPQIKSWVKASKTLDLPMICPIRVAERGIRRHIDRTPAGPQRLPVGLRGLEANSSLT